MGRRTCLSEIGRPGLPAARSGDDRSDAWMREDRESAHLRDEAGKMNLPVLEIGGCPGGPELHPLRRLPQRPRPSFTAACDPQAERCRRTRGRHRTGGSAGRARSLGAHMHVSLTNDGWSRCSAATGLDRRPEWGRGVAWLHLDGTGGTRRRPLLRRRDLQALQDDADGALECTSAVEPTPTASRARRPGDAHLLAER